MITPNDPQTAPVARPALLTRRVALETTLVLLLTLAALLPRVLDLGGFVTLDESNFWFDRSERFLEAIQSGNFADTAIRPHPGVTTMWLGSSGILLRRTLLEWGVLDAMPYQTMLALMRLPGTLVHTAGIVVGYALLRRMLPASVAVLAALLWAADPFVIGYSRVLHLDALAATFATLSLLSACVYWHHRARPAYLVLSAVCAALAALSKVTALAVGPLIGLIWLAAWLAPIREQGIENRNQRTGIRRQLVALLAWGAVFALTVVLVWPAVWAAPLEVADLLRASVEEEGNQPHLWGNYYLGEATDVPGPTFYAVTLALRTTPITLLGLLLLPLGWQQARDLPAARRSLLMLAAFVVFFTVAMSLFPKMLNRYLVPVFPALDILAAAGLLWGAAWLAHLLRRTWTARAQWVAAGALGALALLNAAWWHPYGIAAFNQTLGGAPTGAYTFAIGWGEGLDQAADWLHEQPDITGVTVASTMINSFQPLLNDGVQAVSPDGELSEQVGYVVIYVQDTQRELPEPPFDRFYQEETPLHVVDIHGVSYVWIYQVPPPVTHPMHTTFGDTITLRGYDVDTSTLRSTGAISVTTHWSADAVPAQDYMLFTHILTDEGQRIAQVDAPPGGPQFPTSTWEPGRYISREYPVPVSVPLDQPSDIYWLAFGLYDPADFSRLPVNADPPFDAPADGGDALIVPIKLDE
jgi:hypothetical protein